jgi:peptide deformylase
MSHSSTSPSDSQLQDSLDFFAWMIRETPVRYFGDPILTTVCEPVKPQEIKNNLVQEIAQELVQTLIKLRTKTGFGRGLAANQIGYSKRIVAIWLAEEPEVYINPEVVTLAGSGSYWECCFSSGAFVIGEVIRPWTGTFKYLTLEGIEKIIEADERQTRLFLHEIEHLDGHNCTEKYQPRTLKFLRKAKEEIMAVEFKKIS